MAASTGIGVAPGAHFTQARDPMAQKSANLLYNTAKNNLQGLIGGVGGGQFNPHGGSSGSSGGSGGGFFGGQPRSLDTQAWGSYQPVGQGVQQITTGPAINAQQANEGWNRLNSRMQSSAAGGLYGQLTGMAGRGAATSSPGYMESLARNSRFADAQAGGMLSGYLTDVAKLNAGHQLASEQASAQNQTDLERLRASLYDNSMARWFNGLNAQAGLAGSMMGALGGLSQPWGVQAPRYIATGESNPQLELIRKAENDLRSGMHTF